MSDNMTPTWQTDDGRIQLYCGDCLKILPEIGKVDAVITDPPYGIGEHGGACRTRGRPGYSKHKNLGWDNETPSAEVFSIILHCSEIVVVWGGNYFADKLPTSMGWLYWRKLMGGDFSDGELAWTSRQMALREFTKCPKRIDKTHPCQKPVELMEWSMDRAMVPIGTTTIVADPFMGSGTTGIACIRTGRKFIGIEISPEYFEIAKNRIKIELQQQLLPL